MSTYHLHSYWWADARETNSTLFLSYSHPQLTTAKTSCNVWTSRKQIRNSGKVIFRTCAQVTKWEWQGAKDPKCGTLPSLSNMSAHAFKLWSQVGTSTTAAWDTCVDQPKLPMQPNTAQISQQMTVNSISLLCLPRCLRNSATVHQVNNGNLPHPPVLRPPSQTSSTQPEVVEQFAALKDLTYRVTNWLWSFKSTVLSAVRFNLLLLVVLFWWHWTLVEFRVIDSRTLLNWL